MVTFTRSDLLAYIARQQQGKEPLPGAGVAGVQREAALHESIMGYCDRQWPKWKYVHGRMDKKSTLEEGVPDFIILMPGGRLLLVECKAAGKKLSEAQRNWAKETQMLGHETHVVRSMEEFLALVKGQI